MPYIRRGGRPGLIGLAARTAVVAGTATAVSGSMSRRQQQRAQSNYDQQNYQAQQQQAQMEAVAQQAVAQHAAAQQTAQQAAAPAPGAAAADDLMTRLQQLATMHAQGILSDDEFAAAKAKILG